MKTALFASGNGSNVQALIEAVEKGKLAIEICCLICDKPDAYVVQRAKDANIPVWTKTFKTAGGKQLWELSVLEYLQSKQVELIVLAGFMRLIGQSLLSAYPNRIVNIHPSLLPKFPGLHGIRDAYQAGETETGVTVHWVDAGMDTGPIIAQERVKIVEGMTLAELEEKIHQVEHRLYQATIQQIVMDEKRMSEERE